MELWPVTDLRELFFNRFGDLCRWSSRPVIPVQDSTMPPIHIAMNSLKELFSKNPPPDKGSLFCFNCIRIGDTLEDYSDIHHLSLNEIPTTWSSGEHTRETISKVLEFLLVDCEFEAKNIYALYYPSVTSNLDIDCMEVLLEYLTQDNIISSTCKGSYWNINDNGPCGPCLQFYYYDALPEYESRSPQELINQNHHDAPRIWTIVFVQFNRQDGLLKELELKHVITAMDFENLLIVLQGTLHFYDTDVAVPLLEIIQEFAVDGTDTYANYINYELAGCAEGTDQRGMAYRVIANHLRIMAVATTDVTQIGDRGREYLLKFIDRQAIQLGIEKLKILPNHYAKLVRKSIKAMVHLFPDHPSSKDRLKQIVQSEVRIYKITSDEIAFEEAQRQPAIRTKKAGKQLDDLEPSTTWYRTREIEFWGHRTHILHTDRKKKCCLAALCNALLLGGKISLGENITHISEGQLLYLVQNCLLCGNGNMELQNKLERSDFQKKVLNVLPDLLGILSIDVKPHSINGFVESPQTSLFEYLGVPLYHGCLMDTEDEVLDPGDPGLTLQGLTSLRAGLREKEPCVLFWNGCFITATNLKGSVYLLLDDMRFLDKLIFWELLKEAYQGGLFTDYSFAHVDLDPSYTTLPLTKSEKRKWKKEKKGAKDRTAVSTTLDTLLENIDLEKLHNTHQIDIRSANTSYTCQAAISPPSSSKHIYKTSQINFLGRQVNIIHQESNGPCCLIAICNVLLLKCVISLEPNATEVHEDYLIDILQQYLQQSKGGLPYSEMPIEANNSLQDISNFLEVDVTFDRIDSFKELPQNILIRFLGISLYHVWLPDPHDDILAKLSSYSYSTLQIATSESTVPNVEQAREFLEGSQFTHYGLRCLRDDLKEKEPCILFWQKHYSAVIKIGSEVYALATAAHYIGTPVVWEWLGHDGDTEPMDGNFVSAVTDPCLNPLHLPGTMPDYTTFSSHEQSGPLASTPVHWREFSESARVLLLEEYEKCNPFSERKELSVSSVPLVVADTTREGRLIADDLLQQIVHAHQALYSWNGQFCRILVRLGWRPRLSAQIDAEPQDMTHEAMANNYTSFVNDYTSYVNEVLTLFKIEGVGYPAFFLPLIKTLKEESDRGIMSNMEFAKFCMKVQNNLALRFTLVRGEFWGGIHRIRRNAPLNVRAALKIMLKEEALIDGKDWRTVICESEDPLLMKILRYTEEDDESVDNNIGNDESANKKEFGNFLPSIDSASQYPRQVNEHGGIKSKDHEGKDTKFDSFSELDLLYSHYLEEPLEKAHELVLTSDLDGSMALFDWVSEVVDMLERPELNRT